MQKNWLEGKMKNIKPCLFYRCQSHVLPTKSPKKTQQQSLGRSKRKSRNPIESEDREASQTAGVSEIKRLLSCWAWSAHDAVLLVKVMPGQLRVKHKDTHLYKQQHTHTYTSLCWQMQLGDNLNRDIFPWELEKWTLYYGSRYWCLALCTTKAGKCDRYICPLL